MGSLLGLTWPEAAAVATSAVVLFVVLLVGLRLSRARLVTRLGALDVVLLLVLGAVVGRGVLGNSPTLAGAVLGFVVLLLARIALGLVARTRRWRPLVAAPPLLLVAGGVPLEDHLRTARIRRDELATALRTAGVSGLDEVACAVLEPNGVISVTRFDRSRPLDRALFDDIRGIERMPDGLFAGDRVTSTK